MTKTKQPADRLRRIEREVCADLNVAPDDELCRHVSTLRLMRENMQAKLVVGERVDPDDLLRVDAALKAYLPQGKPATIEVKIIDGLHATCPRCGHHTAVDKDKLKRAVKVEGVPDTATATATAETPSGHAKPIATPSTDAPAPPPAPQPVPVVTHRPGVSASNFHNAMLPNGEVAPLKRATARLISPLSVEGY
jgi:hypothetical protein